MDAVEDIKARLSIEDVVSRYVELKRAGRNFRGLSPFGNEKTPSFMVSPEKQIWHDFSSGKGGTMFSFIMEMEGVDFKGALEILARQAGVDLTQYKQSGAGGGDGGKHKERLHQALDMSANFYQVHFTRNKAALEYILAKRQFTKQTVIDFRIGFAPDGDAPLCRFLLSKGFTGSEIQAAGLGSNRYGSYRDMFRGRIVFPLADPQGRIIGFTARQLIDDPEAPKYINTPQTQLYDKSRHIFGLHMAKETIRRSGFAVVVEGNLDVIASHQSGVKQVMATAGTAMTEQHLKALGRFSEDIRLCFDQDKAGLAATERTIPIASKVGVSLGIIDIEGGKDPDELIRKDPKLWEAAIHTQKYAFDWLIEQYGQRLDLTSATGKREFSDVLLRVVRGVVDPVEQDHFLARIAELIGVSTDALRDKLKRQVTTTYTPALKKIKPRPPLDKHVVERVKAQNQLLAICLASLELRSELAIITPDMLPDEPAKKTLEFLKGHPEYVASQKAKPPKGIGEYLQILVLLYEELYQDLEITDLRFEATRLQVRLIDYYVKIKKEPLIAAMRAGSHDADADLLRQVKELDKLLKSRQSTKA